MFVLKESALLSNLSSKKDMKNAIINTKKVLLNNTVSRRRQMSATSSAVDSNNNNWSKGKVIIVTGAANGIGSATALRFGKAGVNVVLSDLSSSESNGLSVVKEIQQHPGAGKAIFVKCDVSKSKDVENLVKTTMGTFGRLDLAYNNAGIEGAQADTANCTEENFDRVINTNLKGVFLCMKYELQEMLKNKVSDDEDGRGQRGAIVNCSSVAGVIGFPMIPAYDASKHGIIGLTKTAALENAKTKIRVNCVCPGIIRTPMIDRFTQGSKEAEAAMTAYEPVGREGLPDEIAGAVFWLCSPAASFVTGHPLVVDGGWVAQ